MYFNEELVDFGGGLDATVIIMPTINQNGEQINIDGLGIALIDKG